LNLSNFDVWSCYSIEMPPNVEIRLESRLKQIDGTVFTGCEFPISVPATSLVMADQASPNPLQISLHPVPSCFEYAR
jgi:hypothetical protein